MAAPTFEDGIYFNIDEQQYHEVERISGSALSQIRISPADWWADSWLNPSPRVLTPEQQAAKDRARIVGRAYHTARLEPHLLDKRFVRGFVASPNALTSGAAIEKELGARQLTKKQGGESIIDQANRLVAAGYEGPIKHLEEAEWEDTVRGRQPIAAVTWDEMLVDMERLRAVPEADALLSNGAAEVSIFYTCASTGLPMKTRLDYLKADSWSDFKSFANPNGKHVETAISHAFMYNRYHIKAWVQREAVELIRSGALDPKGDFTGDQLALIEALRARDAEAECWYIYQQKGGVPNIKCKRLEFFTVPVNTTAQHAGADDSQRAAMDRGTRTITGWAHRAKEEVVAAKREYQTYMEVYERGQTWLPFDPVGTHSDADFPPAWLDMRI